MEKAVEMQNAKDGLVGESGIQLGRPESQVIGSKPELPIIPKLFPVGKRRARRAVTLP
jgi:hypothetical protein